LTREGRYHDNPLAYERAISRSTLRERPMHQHAPTAREHAVRRGQRAAHHARRNHPRAREQPNRRGYRIVAVGAHLHAPARRSHVFGPAHSHETHSAGPHVAYGERRGIDFLHE
jgi:hypothetical protein